MPTEAIAGGTGLSMVVEKRDLVAIKLHFGEMGNTAFIRPVFLRQIVENVKNKGRKALFNRCPTHYIGSQKRCRKPS